MSTPTANVLPAKRRSRARALRPLFIWLIGSLLVAGWYLQRRITEGNSVTLRLLVDGQPVSDGLTVKVDGQPFASGDRLRFGKRTLVVEGNATEPFQKTFSVSFRAIDLGEIALKRSEGTLEVRSEPAPKEVRVAGRLFAGTNTNSSATFSSLPVGEYKVVATFEHLTEERTVQVRRNETSRLEIRPAVGTFDLATEPQSTEFKLDAERFGGLALSGKAPAQLPQLPAGNYRLRVWRKDYAKDLNVEIKSGETNRQSIVFEYGEVQFLTTPAGATVVQDGNEQGVTPRTVGELKPGRYSFRLQMEGFTPVEVPVVVQGKDSVVVRTNLVNRRYAAAMERARGHPGSGFSNLKGAMIAVEEALQAQPGDADAVALKAKIEAGLKEEEAKAAEQKKLDEARLALKKAKDEADAKKNALEARKRESEEAFKKVTQAEGDANVFETYVWPVKGEAKMVRDAILRVVAQSGSGWKLVDQAEQDGQGLLIRLGGKGLLGGKGKHSTILITQLAPDEANVYAKFWDYVAGKDFVITLKGEPKGLVPAPEAQRKANAEEFRGRFMKELER